MGRYLFGRSALIFLWILPFSLFSQEIFFPVNLENQYQESSYLFTDEYKAEDFPIQRLDIVEDYLQDFSSNWGKSYLSTLDRRSKPFRYTLSYKIFQSGLPLDLINLPLIESAWNPRSRSVSGAQGLWQFMLNSIPKHFVVDRWRDDRRDILLSTDAAISKLQYNLNRVNGDWLLALAGYNCGINLISRSMDKNVDQNYWTLREKGILPEQTRDYIPRFLVVNHLLHRKIRYGIEIDWSKSPCIIEVPLNSNVFLPAMAETLAMDFETLYQLNAELNEWINPPGDSSYRMKLLYYGGIKPEYLISEEPLTDNMDIDINMTPVITLYKVEEGDSLWSIAQLYSCSVSQIKEINGLEDSEIHPGMLLFLP